MRCVNACLWVFRVSTYAYWVDFATPRMETRAREPSYCVEVLICGNFFENLIHERKADFFLIRFLNLVFWCQLLRGSEVNGVAEAIQIVCFS